MMASTAQYYNWSVDRLNGFLWNGHSLIRSRSLSRSVSVSVSVWDKSNLKWQSCRLSRSTYLFVGALTGSVFMNCHLVFGKESSRLFKGWLKCWVFKRRRHQPDLWQQQETTRPFGMIMKENCKIFYLYMQMYRDCISHNVTRKCKINCKTQCWV